jgi:hypothetical protein
VVRLDTEGLFNLKRNIADKSGFDKLIQQLPIKRTTRKFLKVLLRNTFKNFLVVRLRAKRCKSSSSTYGAGT